MTYGKSVAVGRRMTEHDLRQEMVRIGRMMWERGYVVATDGNLSARLGADRLLVTPSGVSKGFLAADDLMVIHPDGKLARRGTDPGEADKPSSEILMHLEVYRQRPDVQAVVHAHPPIATAFSIAGVTLARCVLPEVVITLGGIPTVDYATPGTTEVPVSIRRAIQEYDAIILAHHGSLTVGSSLWEAYLRLEKVEHTAQITLAAQQLGQVGTLSPEAVAELATLRHDLLQRQGRDVCDGCTACLLGDNYQAPLGGSPSAAAFLDEESLVRQITQAVVENLEGGRARQ